MRWKEDDADCFRWYDRDHDCGKVLLIPMKILIELDFLAKTLFFSHAFLPSSVIPILATLTSSGRSPRPQISWYRYGWQGYVSLKVQTMVLASCHVLGVIQSDWTYRTATSSRCIVGVRGARQTYRYRTDDLLSYRRRMHMRSAMWRELSCARFLTCRQQ
jgi:hypothetical protein